MVRKDSMFEDRNKVIDTRPEARAKKGRGGIMGILAAIGVILFKFKGILIALKFGKFAGTFLSMFIMMWFYAKQFGWWYAAGFVMLIFVHESGHFFAARYMHLDVSAPIFIPFVGAFITMKQQPTNARTEAIIAAGGPVLGSIGALFCLAMGLYLRNGLLIALAYSGAFLNLFNLIPVHPLDGGRIVTAISPIMWFLGIPILVIMMIKFPNPVIIIFVILGIFQAFRTMKSADKAYFNVSSGTRFTFAVLYFGLMIVLGVTMFWIRETAFVK
jgi:Zn-dependent protease